MTTRGQSENGATGGPDTRSQEDIDRTIASLKCEKIDGQIGSLNFALDHIINQRGKIMRPSYYADKMSMQEWRSLSWKQQLIKAAAGIDELEPQAEQCWVDFEVIWGKRPELKC